MVASLRLLCSKSDTQALEIVSAGCGRLGACGNCLDEGKHRPGKSVGHPPLLETGFEPIGRHVVLCHEMERIRTTVWVPVMDPEGAFRYAIGALYTKCSVVLLGYIVVIRAVQEL